MACWYGPKGQIFRNFIKEFVIESSEFCQNNLQFSYGEEIYRQNDGTGMGRIYAPSLADLKQAHDEIVLEKKLHEKLPAEMFAYFVKHYVRYLDDIWSMWQNSMNT